MDWKVPSCFDAQLRWAGKKEGGHSFSPFYLPTYHFILGHSYSSPSPYILIDDSGTLFREEDRRGR